MDYLEGFSGWFNYRLFELGGTTITVGSLVTVVLVITATWWLSRALQNVLARTLKRRGMVHAGTLQASQRLVHYLVMVLGTSVGLDAIGINLSALFAAGAVFAVAIAFAMQTIVQNFVSGVILLVERAIKPGDVLEVNGTVIRVIDMGIRSTIARTRDEEDLIIPNGLLVQNTVKNFTLRDTTYRIRALVGVHYDSDIRAVLECLERVAMDAHHESIPARPQVQLKGFGASSVDFEVQLWIDDPWNANTRLSELYKAIWYALKEAGIVIAYPQLDVHISPPAPGLPGPPQ